MSMRKEKTVERVIVVVCLVVIAALLVAGMFDGDISHF